MTQIESFLAIGGLVLFSLISLRFNSAALDNKSYELENKVVLTAFSLGDDLIEEMKVKSFDQATRNFPATKVSLLTPTASLGKEDALYDDLDDYNGYHKLITAPHAEDYTVDCKVEYVQAGSPDTPSSTQTFYKRAIVTVGSPYLKHSVQLFFVFTHK